MIMINRLFCKYFLLILNKGVKLRLREKKKKENLNNFFEF